MQAQGREFDLFVLQQSPGLRFNRGALLNAGALLLAGSRYDHFVFHDVDTLPQLKANIGYSFPSGARPLHMTPLGIHPRVNYEVSSELPPCLHLLPQRRFWPQRMPAPRDLQSLGGASRVSGQVIAAVQDFFGGVTVFTPQQLRVVGGYGTNFWG